MIAVLHWLAFSLGSHQPAIAPTQMASSASCVGAVSSALVYLQFQIGSTDSTCPDLRIERILKVFLPQLFVAFAILAETYHLKVSALLVKDRILFSRFLA